MAILVDVQGETDIFGKSYGFPAGSPGADAYGDSRPSSGQLSSARPAIFRIQRRNAAYD
jgi:hypothetical protein